MEDTKNAVTSEVERRIQKPQKKVLDLAVFNFKDLPEFGLTVLPPLILTLFSGGIGFGIHMFATALALAITLCSKGKYLNIFEWTFQPLAKTYVAINESVAKKKQKENSSRAREKSNKKLLDLPELRNRQLLPWTSRNLFCMWQINGKHETGTKRDTQSNTLAIFELQHQIAPNPRGGFFMSTISPNISPQIRHERDNFTWLHDEHQAHHHEVYYKILLKSSS